jgi:hypothetical protein
MLENEGRRGVRYECGPNQPHRRGEPLDQRASEARHIVAPVNRKAVFGTGSADQDGSHGFTIAVDDGIA